MAFDVSWVLGVVLGLSNGKRPEQGRFDTVVFGHRKLAASLY